MSDTLLQRAERVLGTGALAGFRSDADLPLLGAANLRLFVSRMRYHEGEATDAIGEFKSAQSVLMLSDAELLAHRGPKGAGDVELTAAPRHSVYRLTPTDETHARMRKGDTSLRTCGWCRYAASSGVFNGNALIAGDCGLLKPLGVADSAVWIDTPCRVTGMPAAAREAAVQAAQGFLDARKAKRTDLQSVIRALRTMASEATDAPVLPSWRKGDAFEVGDKVVVWLYGTEKLTTRVPFVTGRVVPGFRHHDGLVNVETDLPVSSSEYKDGRGITSGVNRGCLVTFNDFWYLRNAALSDSSEQRRFVELWLAHSELGTKEQAAFSAALREGQISGR